MLLVGMNPSTAELVRDGSRTPPAVGGDWPTSVVIDGNIRRASCTCSTARTSWPDAAPRLPRVGTSAGADDDETSRRTREVHARATHAEEWRNKTRDPPTRLLLAMQRGRGYAVVEGLLAG